MPAGTTAKRKRRPVYVGEAEEDRDDAVVCAERVHEPDVVGPASLKRDIDALATQVLALRAQGIQISARQLQRRLQRRDRGTSNRSVSRRPTSYTASWEVTATRSRS